MVGFAGYSAERKELWYWLLDLIASFWMSINQRVVWMR